MKDDSTIFALATPYGKSSIAVIRISGNRALETLKHLGIKLNPVPRMATLNKLYTSTHHMIDQAIIIYFQAPDSFTGEDIVEIQSHGGTAVINCILDELAKNFAPANPGDFSKRAFLNGRMDLAQAEGLADLIDAETRMQLHQAARQLSGDLSSICKSWHQQLLDISAQIEAIIDFPEEEIPETILIKVNIMVNSLILSIQKHISQNSQAKKIKDGFYIAILGLPNAGKSTLINHITKRDIAIVSPISGTTRDIVETHLELSGHSVTFADTAGLHNTKDEIENEGIKRAKKKAAAADITIILMPLEEYIRRRGLDPLLSELIDDKTIIVLSKIDALSDIPNNLPSNFILISVHNQIGLVTLNKAIIDKIRIKVPLTDPPLITRERHVQTLNMALFHLNLFNTTKPIELCAEDIRSTINSIKSIVGEITSDEILGTIFSKFCVGK